MRAVWSFWSKPFHSHRAATWFSPFHHLLAWGLSLRAASQHYPETVLITDQAGKKLLVDQLGLPFMHISTELEQIRDADPDWWALGKILAYSIQDRPFVHLDTDVFLWKRLPPQVEQAHVFSQCPERIAEIDGNYRPREVEAAFARFQLPLPVEWEWSRSRNPAALTAENCGIFGGNNVKFLNYCSKMALNLILRPEHAPVWALANDKRAHTILLEQWFMTTACTDYHRFHPTSPYKGVKITRLFPNDQSIPAGTAAQLGYTHLFWIAKSHPAVARRLEDRVRREDPEFYRRCVRLCDNSQLALSGA
ncbi:MAG TPA: DUF6734 family protein [Tepidisphaeraceae bacterium]|jgi:hypothetical protein|nr:DUF6734 family protein [Tepidisphaeraceae bacterium]